MLSLLLGLEIPKLFQKLAVHYNSVVLFFFYHVTTFKYCIYDVYRWQIDVVDSNYAVVFMRMLLLLNMTHFACALSNYYQEKLQCEMCFMLEKEISSGFYFFRTLAISLYGKCPPHLVCVNMGLSITAHTFYSENSVKKSYINFYFYSVALHVVMVLEMWETLTHAPPLLAACVVTHCIAFTKKMQIYYFTEEKEKVIDFINICCTSFNFFLVYLLTKESYDLQELWFGAMQLYAVFLFNYFQSFGKLTSIFTNSLLIMHSVTVSKMYSIR